MKQLRRTVLYRRHVDAGARMVEFGGWGMPLEYPTGIVREHLATRKGAGLFDVSHMGRFVFRGRGALEFLHNPAFSLKILAISVCSHVNPGSFLPK